MRIDIGDATLHIGDAQSVLTSLPNESVNCVVTSPPYYGLRDYGVDGQIGLEQSPQEYIDKLVAVFREARRVLVSDGTCWINIGDSYAGSWGAQSRENPGNQASSMLQGGSMLSARQITAHPKRTHTGSVKNTPGLKPKDLMGIPWRLAFALQADGWYLRQDIIWSKPNPMPESVRDRCTKSHEYLFLLSKSQRYYWDAEAIAEPAAIGFNGSSFTSEYDRATKSGLGEGDRRERETRNKRSVWTVSTKPYREAHFATFPPELIEPCVLAGCPVGGVVLDPFAGSGTTGEVAIAQGRKALLIELNPEYGELIKRRVKSQQQRLFA